MGEKIMGYYIRSGAWVDGLQVITNNRRSDVFGNKNGGSGHELVPPQGYEIVGLSGNIQAWVYSIGIVYVAA